MTATKATGASVHMTGRARAPVRVATAGKPSQDLDGEVRDWATMGLGSRLEVDNPAIRNPWRRASMISGATVA